MDNFFKCACHAEGIHIERDIDLVNRDTDVFDVQVYFSKWHMGTANNRATLKEKLRHCWQILKTGHNFADDVILDVAKSRELANYILELTNEDSINKEVQSLIQQRKDRRERMRIHKENENVKV